MLINVANPTPTRADKKARAKKGKKPKKGGQPMAKHRSAAQKRATAKLLAWNRSHRRGGAKRNPTHKKRHYKASHRRHNPTRTVRFKSRARKTMGSITAGAKSFFGDLMNTQGMLMVGGIIVAPTVLDLVSEKIPGIQDLTGWKRQAARGAVAVGVPLLVDYLTRGKFRKATIGFAASGVAVVIADSIKLARVQQAAPAVSDTMADQIVANPLLFEKAMSGDFSTATLPTSPHAAQLGGYGSTYAGHAMGGYGAGYMGDTMAGGGAIAGHSTGWHRQRGANPGGWNRESQW